MKSVLKFILISKQGHKNPKRLEHKGSEIYIHACTQVKNHPNSICSVDFGSHMQGV